jgi:hypothetical protein
MPGRRAGLSHFWRLVMADFYSPTVIQQKIPVADITPLERLVLSHIFDAQLDGETFTFHAADGPETTIWAPITDLRAAFDVSTKVESTTADYFADRLTSASIVDGDIEIDFSGMSWEFILQDIVRRSSTLRYLTAVTSFTCSQMQADGFGGMAVLITADAIKGKSTEDILCELLDEAEHGPLASAPGFGVHVMLRLGEENVRDEIANLIAVDETLTKLAPEAVLDTDIRAACFGVVALTDLAEEQSSTVFKAALTAIRQAEQRVVLAA